MSPETVTIVALVVIFATAMFLPIDMGPLAFTGAFSTARCRSGSTTDDILTGFPAELVVTLIGVTHLFAVAQHNGTVDLLVRGANRSYEKILAYAGSSWTSGRSWPGWSSSSSPRSSDLIGEPQ